MRAPRVKWITIKHNNVITGSYGIVYWPDNRRPPSATVLLAIKAMVVSWPDSCISS